MKSPTKEQSYVIVRFLILHIALISSTKVISINTVTNTISYIGQSYTGNWDLVGNNTPIFFIRDPILFPSFIHTQKRNPVTHLKDPDAMWDFITLRPETTHQVTTRHHHSVFTLSNITHANLHLP